MSILHRIPGPVSEQQLTAYHEAGHAVMSLHHGWVVRWLAILRYGNELGSVYGTSATSFNDIAEAVRNPDGSIMACDVEVAHLLLGGPIAEVIRAALASEDITDAVQISKKYRHGSEDDLARVTALSTTLHETSNEAEAWIDTQVHAVETLLLKTRRVWDATAALASALLEHRAFDGSHAEWLYESVMAGRSYLECRKELSERIRENPGFMHQFFSGRDSQEQVDQAKTEYLERERAKRRSSG